MSRVLNHPIVVTVISAIVTLFINKQQWPLTVNIIGFQFSIVLLLIDIVLIYLLMAWSFMIGMQSIMYAVVGIFFQKIKPPWFERLLVTAYFPFFRIYDYLNSRMYKKKLQD